MKDIYKKITELFPRIEEIQYVKLVSIASNGAVIIVLDGDYFHTDKEIGDLFYNSNIKVYSYNFDKRTNTYFATIKF